MVDPSAWRQIDPKVKTLWRLGAVFNALIFGGITVALDFAIIRNIWEKTPIPPFVIPGAVALIFLVLGVAFTDARYQNFRFRIGEDDLALSQGIWFKSQRFVNRARIQHVDVNTNFMAARLGLTEVQVHVGAQVGAAITLSGLTPPEAEEIRRTLLEGNMVRYREAAEAPPAPPAPLSPPPVAPPAASAFDPLAAPEAPHGVVFQDQAPVQSAPAPPPSQPPQPPLPPQS